MKTFLLALIFAGAALAADPCTIDLSAIYADPALIITDNADGTQTIEANSFDDYLIWLAYIASVSDANQ